MTIGYRTCDETGACTSANLVLTVAGSPVEPGNLAYTGDALGPLAVIAVSLLLAGAVLLSPVGPLRRRLRARAGRAGP